MGNWAKTSNITGPNAKWFTGPDYPSISMPSPVGRIDGDMYLKTVDPDGGTVWRWDGGTLVWLYTGADITGPQGLPGLVQAVIEGARIGVDSTDPANPIVSADPAAWADITGKPATFPPTVPIDWDDVSDKPATFPPTLPIAQAGVTNLVSDLALKAPLASPALTGVPTVPTAAPGTSTLQAASTAFVAAIVAGLSAVYQPLAAALTSWAGVTRAAGFDAFTAAPSSANLRTLLTDESGTGAALFQNGALGTPASGVATNLTGLPYGGLLAAAIATAAEYLSNTASKVASVNTLWAAAGVVNITYAASVALNFNTFIDCSIGMTGNLTLAAPTNMKSGQKGIIWLTASGAPRTVTLNAAYALTKGVEAGPYAVPTGNWLGVAYVVHGATIFVTAIIRYP